MPNNIPEQNILVSWETEGEKKSAESIGIIIVLTLAAIVASVLNFRQKELMPGASFIVIAIALLYYAFSKPSRESFAVSDVGLIINGKTHAFDDIKQYWYSQATNTIYFQPKKFLGLNTAFSLGTQSFDYIKSLFPDTLLEIKDHGDSLAEKISGIFQR